MGTIIYRGSTPTIYIRPTNGMHVDDLGEPYVSIMQDLVYIPLDVQKDSENNRLVCTLTEEESLELVEGVETLIQAAYTLESGEVYRFPVHKLSVLPTVFENLIEQEGEESV